MFEPRLAAASARSSHPAGARISRYLADCARFAVAAFARPPGEAGGDIATTVEAIIAILLGDEFNFQSRGRVAHLVPAVREALAVHVARGAPIQLFMSYNGGYHATTRADFSEPLGFDAGITEFLFLYMIARLKHRLAAVYPPGMTYHVVLNNGVAAYVNDIPVARTEAYARQFEAMAARLGAARDVRVVVQSELGDFSPRMAGVPIPPLGAIDAAAHHNIERFLGRPCSEAEARRRFACYQPAEAVWWEELREIIAAANGIRLLQVASPNFLSFRPFPGSATRSQTGQVGFRLQGDKVVPMLVTTLTAAKADVVPVAVSWPAPLAAAMPTLACGDG
ncbi:hypothetical protein [Methylobrevis albus]|uniref:Uncharacterized protein n=1 Tax=Methylobrevis albus TaxID=2793297 RepID=A0A931I541_9HYPH|nr:hypothetical protein [Methylobrevis albus]MBH0239001.1 hypothetical protein [Methylobrevis albus]